MTKQEFLELLARKVRGGLADRPRSETEWWLALEELSLAEYHRNYFKDEKERALK